MRISRRDFLAATAVATHVDAKTGMPMRVLGRTGASVSVLAFGCGSRFVAYKTDEEAIAALNRALDQGVTYVDTSASYGDGVSETRVGQVMKSRRKQVFLATKVPARPADEAMRSIEASLKRLQTDHVDLLHIHGLMDEKDLAAAESGALKVLYKMRDQKIARFIGVSCHAFPSVLKTALERHDFDVTQMALNAALVGNSRLRPQEEALDPLTRGFENVALPVALRKKMGVIAMKVFAQEKLLPKAPVEKLIQYSMSLPVTAIVAGMPKVEHIDENIRLVKTLKAMPPEEMRSLSQKLAAVEKASLDRYFAQHVDA
jgi:uncharacterized protein